MTGLGGPWLWWVALGAAVLLFPVDAQLFPVWLVLRLRLWWINTTMRVQAYRMWLQLPKPRPPFRFVPVQDRPRRL